MARLPGMRQHDMHHRPALDWTSPLSVVWIVEGSDPYLPALAAALEPSGLRIATSTASGSPAMPADLRVLPAWAFDRHDRLVAEYPLDARPTLLLALDDAGVAALLELARPSDEVGHAKEPPASLLKRLQRLASRVASYRRADEAAERDALTGLWNRKRFTQTLATLPSDPLADSIGFSAILFLDLDRFKQINDQNGHLVGDQVLQQVGGALRRVLHPNDASSRVGGDEFAVLLTRPDEATVLADAETIRRRVGGIRLPSTDSAEPLAEVSASAGLALHQPGLSPEAWLKRADVALYEAKTRGRDCLVSYASMESGADADDPSLRIRHFQNVTRVVSERVANLIAIMGQQVVGSLQRDANQDALTGVNNRRYYDNRIAREFELAAKDARKLTLAFLDIDNFGAFNRSFGAPTGDAVLKQFAQVVGATIRPVDWMARYGGEEFCVVMPTSLNEGLTAAERLRSAVEQARMQAFDGRPVTITVSIGVAEHVDPLQAPALLVQRASKALQEAKRQGRNRVVAAGP